MSQGYNKLAKAIAGKKAKVAIIGLGHVGLPEAVAFAEAGFGVIGYDISEEKIASIRDGRCGIVDVDDVVMLGLLERGQIELHTSSKILSTADVFVIAVPTLLSKHKNPDVAAVKAVAADIAANLEPPALVILESTGPPGVTQDVVKAALETRGHKADKDFFLACSPARVDPANPEWRLVDIPKIVGGLTPESTDLVAALYERVVASVVRASSLKAAEMTKLLENSFRAVNIAFIDQMHMICQAMGLDIWEIIDLASTKPFGFVPFYPGPGPGGECIPVDPFYVAWKAREHEFKAHFIELAGETMDTIPVFFVRMMADLLNDDKKPLKGAKILLLGVAYKKNVGDISRSPAFAMAKLLEEHGAKLGYHDPYIKDFSYNGTTLSSRPLDRELLREQDGVIIVTDHSNVDYNLVVENSALILDTRNALADYRSPNIHR